MKTWIDFMFFADRRPGINVSLRILLAVCGGYGLALLCAATLATGLPLAFSHDAVALAVMLAFIVQLLAILWVFATATLLRAALGLALPAAFFGLWLLLQGAAS